MNRKSLKLSIIIVIISLIHIESNGLEQRRKLGFKEKGQNGNFTFDCSPSGPCLPCQYSEKTEDKYRCSETGYRIPFKCTGDVKKEESSKKSQNSDSTSGESSTNGENAAKDKTSTDNASAQEVERHEYVTYRSCTQDVNEEKLSVLGFEVLVLGMLLVSGSFVVFRRKKTVATAASTGGVRLQSNPRF